MSLPVLLLAVLSAILYFFARATSEKFRLVFRALATLVALGSEARRAFDGFEKIVPKRRIPVLVF